MYALVGHFHDIVQMKIGEPFENMRREEVVALFTTRAHAQTYERKARLKNPYFESFVGYRKYRKATLLGECEDSHIEEYNEPELPINPEI